MTEAATTVPDIAVAVAESRAEQGLPPTLDDPVALDQIATLVVLAVDKRL